jgi:hypothetical protein
MLRNYKKFYAKKENRERVRVSESYDRKTDGGYFLFCN